MKPKFILPIFLLVLLQACTSCDPNGAAKCKKEYTFELSFTLSPALDTFRLQDTIWIESIIEPKLLDLTSGDSIFIDTFDFRVNSNIIKFIPNVGWETAEHQFYYVDKAGQFKIFNYSFGSEALLLYAHESNKQKIRFGMIPKEVGVFDISFYLLSDNLRDVNFPEDCHVDIVDVTRRMNTGVDNNFYLVKDFYSKFFPDISFDEEDFNLTGGYAFVVIE